jgi:dTDP-4-amino-4,6-dideoxygalactose transaminase
MVYYPVPLYEQEAYRAYAPAGFSLPVTHQLCKEVISLPMHTELSREMLQTIITAVKEFFN